MIKWFGLDLGIVGSMISIDDVIYGFNSKNVLESYISI